MEFSYRLMTVQASTATGPVSWSPVTMGSGLLRDNFSVQKPYPIVHVQFSMLLSDWLRLVCTHAGLSRNNVSLRMTNHDQIRSFDKAIGSLPFTCIIWEGEV